jgi:hypothetical protein
MRVTNWGMFLLGIYLVIAGIISLGYLFRLAQLNALVGLVAGILILTEHSRR